MKWIVFAVIAVLLAVWLVRGRRSHPREDPEAKLVSRQRYYVSPPEKNEAPPDDQLNRKS